MTTNGQTTRLQSLDGEYTTFERDIEALVRDVCDNDAVLEFKATDHTEITDTDAPNFYTFHAQMDLRAGATE